jgi:hypothetical protein
VANQPVHVIQGIDATSERSAAPCVPEPSKKAAHPNALNDQQCRTRDQVDVSSRAKQRAGRDKERKEGDPDRNALPTCTHECEVDIERDQCGKHEWQDPQGIARGQIRKPQETLIGLDGNFLYRHHSQRHDRQEQERDQVAPWCELMTLVEGADRPRFAHRVLAQPRLDGVELAGRRT